LSDECIGNTFLDHLIILLADFLFCSIWQADELIEWVFLLYKLFV